MTRPIVALVGRPNVGKSTLFNRLIREQLAVVHETPGTTRDRLYGNVEWRGRQFTVVDTGGIGLGESGELQQGIVAQAEAAIREADVVVFLTDARAGPTPSEVDIADRLRRSQKPVVLVANKGDSPKDRMKSTDFYELGLDEPLAISAMNGIGTGDLLDRIVDLLPPGEEADEEDEHLGVAIVGRPNVGKSSLLNAIAGEERALVSSMPGTTRDTVDTLVQHKDQPILLVDTAGIRRRGRIERGIETYSVMRAMRAIERADVGGLVLDADAGIMAQDAHVAGYIQEAVKGCVIAVNKWDLVPRSPEAGAKYTEMVRRELPFLAWAPMVFISAQSGLNVPRVLDRVLEIRVQRARRIPTAEFNEFIRRTVQSHPLSEKGKQLKVMYATQAATHPPTFVLFVNDPAMVHFSYRRYLDNQIRREFGFEGTGIRFVFRGRSED